MTRARISGNDIIAKITGVFLLKERERRCQYILAETEQRHLLLKEHNFHQCYHGTCTCKV